MNDYLSKPFTPQEIFEMLARWLPAEHIDEGVRVDGFSRDPTPKTVRLTSPDRQEVQRQVSLQKAVRVHRRL